MCRYICKYVKSIAQAFEKKRFYKGIAVKIQIGFTVWIKDQKFKTKYTNSGHVHKIDYISRVNTNSVSYPFGSCLTIYTNMCQVTFSFILIVQSKLAAGSQIYWPIWQCSALSVVSVYKTQGLIENINPDCQKGCH